MSLLARLILPNDPVISLANCVGTMHISRAVILGLAGLSRLVVATDDQNATDTLIDLNSQAIDALQQAADDAQTTKRANGCSLSNASVRRDWLVSCPL